MKDEEKNYCGVILSNGTFWSWAATPEKAAEAAAKFAKKELRKYGYKIPRNHEFKVNILDMQNHEGWEALAGTGHLFHDTETGHPIEVMQVITASGGY